MAETPHWLRRPLWQSAFIVCGLLVWCLYLAFCWISALPLLVRGLLGVAVGFTTMASFSTSETQRSHCRRLASVHLAQLSLADMLALRRLLSVNHDKALSWLPDPSDAELVRWINVGLEKAWPFLKEASSGLIKVQLEGVLNKYRSGAIQEVLVGKINLGNNCPYIQGIKAFSKDEDNKSCLEIQLDWRQNENQEMLLHVLTSGPEYVVQVKHFMMYCVMRLTFTPLTEELPCFSAVVFSIIEPPLVDFQTRFVSGDVKKMPEMHKAVDNILLAALMDLLVWPGRVVVPLLPGDYSDLEAGCVGRLYVQLMEAKDLANKEISGKADPYVVLFVRRRHDLVKESLQMHDTCDPVWNEQFVFNVEDSTVQKLTIKVMNRDDTNLNVFVGAAERAINQFEANSPEDLWIDLVGDPSRLHGKSAGKVHLLVEFKPFDPSCADKGSASMALMGSSHCAVVSPQPAGKSQTIGERDHTGIDDASEGLRIALEGHRTMNENHALRPITVSVVALSPTDSPIQERAEVALDSTSGTRVELGKLADNYRNSSLDLEDKTETGSVDDGTAKPASRDEVVVAECPSREKHVNGLDVLGGTESQEGIGAESYKESQPWEQISRDFSEEANVMNIEKRREACIEKYETGSSIDTDKETASQHNLLLAGDYAIVKNETGSSIDTDKVTVSQHNLLIAGDPAWGLNGLAIENCDSRVICEDMFSSEIFEVD